MFWENHLGGAPHRETGLAKCPALNQPKKIKHHPYY